MQVFISCLFAAKCLHIVDIVLTQTRHDLFFIDWEQPRAASDAKGDEEANGAMPVSAWRTIFVANEWVKLQVRSTALLVHSPPLPQLTPFAFHTCRRRARSRPRSTSLCCSSCR